MAFCQSIITLVARRGLIDGSGPWGPPNRDRPWHLRLAAQRRRYEPPRLKGCPILVVEDKLLIAMDIAAALEKAGAHATMTTTARCGAQMRTRSLAAFGSPTAPLQVSTFRFSRSLLSALIMSPGPRLSIPCNI